MVDDFLARALPVDADLVASWIRAESLGPYVGGEHKLAAFGDGRYAHGNLFLLRRRFPDRARVRRQLDRLYAARKSTVRFAWELGLPLFLRFLAAQLSGRLPDLEQTLSITGRHFGLTLAPVISPYPEIALDIDEPEDYEAAERHLLRPARGAPVDGQRPEDVEPMAE